MEILSDLPEDKYLEIDEFLAYIGIYDDAERLKAYLYGLARFDLKGKVVVEAGAGFGTLSKKLVELGAKRVYAVEANRRTFNVLLKRTSDFKKIKPICLRIEDFEPNERIDLLVHDFYGSMLYDENLFSLKSLKFAPEIVFPNGGELRVAVVDSSKFTDETVDLTVLEQLKGVVVGDLFPEPELNEADFNALIARWSFEEGLRTFELDLGGMDGDLLAFALFITHDGEPLCSPLRCVNWSIGWTPRTGNRLTVRFDVSEKENFVRTKLIWLD